jgi:hypothetical protein
MNWSDYFTYDSDSGELIWRSRPRDHFTTDNVWLCFLGRNANKIAGHKERSGYTAVRVDYKPYRAHRVIWEMHYGPIPEGMQIDHINMVRSDNRLCNLRLANNAQNNSNRGLQSNNTSGHKGVAWDRSRGKWAAQIMVGQKNIHLGRYDSIDEAVAVRQRATETRHGQFARTE